MDSTADGPVRKVCPKCHQSDNTTFSSCRYCGCKYDWKKTVDPGDFNTTTPIIAMFLLALVGFVGFSVYNMMNGTVVDPKKMVGKTYKSKGKVLLVSPSPGNLIDYDTQMAEAAKNDPKLGGKGVGGIMSAASALDALNNDKDNSYSVLSRFVSRGYLYGVRNDDGPMDIFVADATKNPKNFPIVQIRVMSGPQAGTNCWVNADQLDTESPVEDKKEEKKP